ncbi:MAG: translocation/assembly module TamB domain-containing protein [Sphaerochaetaceae bacterium]
MSIQTGKNVSFIYPNTESPILRATFADNQRITLVVQAPQMTTSIGGQLAFRSGEIYYVQKNFYITEGALKFPSIMTDLTGELLPTLSLRARLREFEPDGSRVDIYLVLQDDNLLDLTPRFESIPIRSTNEILELLGQNIVTAGTGSDSGFTSVVAVASAATDVFSRLGLLQNTTISLGFSSIVRDSLGLDVFTIRTNLLQNILFDALPGIAADTSVSPLARYLDNTTMYIGKYVLDEFYLQGMFHFRRDSLGKGTSFLAQDLRIDTELSIEWSNPLATFSLFTQPEELSVFDLFDTMGFSIIKRFEF